MSLFERPLSEIRSYLDGDVAREASRDLSMDRHVQLAERAAVVLSDETRLELGNPALASCAMVLWGEADEVNDGRITLVGPDFAEAPDRSLPFAQTVIVAGAIEDPPQCFRDLREAIYGLRLEAVSTRNHPASQRVWYRAGAEALEVGFDAATLASALARSALELPFVKQAEVVLVTASREQVRALMPTAELAADIGAALIKMADEMSFDCDSCDFTDICDQIDELRRERERLREKEQR